MLRPSIPQGGPGPSVATLGGAVGTVLATAMLYGAPAAGLPVVDIPALGGGVLFEDPTAAFWLGYVAFFLSGWIVVPAVAVRVWQVLPGSPMGVRGALIKGVALGMVGWLLSGVLVGVLGWLQEAAGPPPAGFFALGLGWEGALVLLAVHLAYGVALAVVAAMSRGLSPVNSIGWMGHGAGRAA